LSKEPHWKVFSASATLIDHSTLTKLEGLDMLKRFVKLAMGMRKKFLVKDVQVHFIERHRFHSWWRGGRYRESLDAPLEPYLVAQFSFRLSSKRPMLSWWHDDTPATMEATILFHLDTQNKVDYIMVDTLMFNGMQIRSLPDLDLSASITMNLKKIEDWLESTKELQLKDIDSLPRQPTGFGFELPQKTPALKTDKVVTVLQSNVINFLQKARSPNWRIFSDELKLIDQFGSGMMGLKPIKRLFGLFSGLSGRLVAKDLQVHFLEPQRFHSWWENGKEIESYDEPLENFLVAKWKVRLSRKSWFGARDDTIPVDIEAETSFRLDEDNRVERVRIEKWLMNGQAVQSWPEIKLTDWRNKNVLKILEWIADIGDSELVQAMLDQASEESQWRLDLSAHTMPSLIESE
jgi:hypothetical protein